MLSDSLTREPIISSITQQSNKTIGTKVSCVGPGQELPTSTLSFLLQDSPFSLSSHGLLEQYKLLLPLPILIPQPRQPAQCVMDGMNWQGNLLTNLQETSICSWLGAGAARKGRAGALASVLCLGAEISKHLEGLCSFSTNWIQARGITTDLCSW